MLELPVSAVKRIVIQVVKPGCKTILVCWLTLMSKEKEDCQIKCELDRNQKGSKAQFAFYCAKNVKFPYSFRKLLLCLDMLFYVVADLCVIFAGMVVQVGS